MALHRVFPAGQPIGVAAQNLRRGVCLAIHSGLQCISHGCAACGVCLGEATNVLVSVTGLGGGIPGAQRISLGKACDVAGG